MEPGHEDREYPEAPPHGRPPGPPQWSPVMKTGNTCWLRPICLAVEMPQWSPVMKTGNTGRRGHPDRPAPRASMEPGHEDREYHRAPPLSPGRAPASMEPGHEDREYRRNCPRKGMSASASMEPGHEDREYVATTATISLITCASMEPGHEDREYSSIGSRRTTNDRASMEPGHEDREYLPQRSSACPTRQPQWSPVMKTGNTSTRRTTAASHSRLNGARS